MADLSQLSDEQLHVYRDLLAQKAGPKVPGMEQLGGSAPGYPKLPETVREIPSLLERFGQTVNPVNWARGIGDIPHVTDPMALAFGTTSQPAQTPITPETTGKDIVQMVPVVNDLAQGNLQGAAGQVLGLGALAGAAKVAPKLAPAVRTAVKTVGKTPAGLAGSSIGAIIGYHFGGNEGAILGATLGERLVSQVGGRGAAATAAAPAVEPTVPPAPVAEASVATPVETAATPVEAPPQPAPAPPAPAPVITAPAEPRWQPATLQQRLEGLSPDAQRQMLEFRAQRGINQPPAAAPVTLADLANRPAPVPQSGTLADLVNPPAPATVAPKVAELSQQINESLGPPAAPAPKVDFKAEAQNAKAQAFAQYLHDAGAQAAHVADAIPLDNFWTQATQGVNQSGSKKWGAPSVKSRGLIVDEMRKLEAAPAAGETAAKVQPIAAESTPPPASGGSFEQVDALAKLVQGQGGTAADLRRFNPQQWQELGVTSPADSVAVIKRIEMLEKAQPFMQGLSDRLQSAADAATERMRQRGSLSGTSLHSMPNPADLADIAIWGAAKLAQGTVKFGQWSKEMVDQLGPQIKPHLEKLFADSQKIYERHIATTSNQLPNTKELMKKLNQGMSGAEWYDKTRGELEQAFGPDAKLFSDFLAATTNNATVEANLAFALKAYKQYRLGQPWEGFMEDVKGQLDKALAGEQFGGLKVQSFQKNLWGEADPVTVDRWMARLYGFRKGGITPGQYKFIDYQITQLANRAKMEPRQVQAALWNAIKEAEQKAGNTSKSFEELLPDRLAKDPELQKLIQRAKAGEVAPPRP